MNSAGLTILFNTIGAAIGPLLAGFILLPHFGFQTSLILSAVAYAVLALLISQKSNWSLRRIPGIAMFLLSAAFIATLAIFPWHRDEIHFANARHPYEADGSVLIRKIERDRGHIPTAAARALR
jgi:MFS family permease